MARRTERRLPVLFGDNVQDIVARAVILEEPNQVVVSIVLEGEAAKNYNGFLTQADPVAVSFIAIPVRNARESKEIM